MWSKLKVLGNSHGFRLSLQWDERARAANESSLVPKSTLSVMKARLSTGLAAYLYAHMELVEQEVTICHVLGGEDPIPLPPTKSSPRPATFQTLTHTRLTPAPPGTE